MTSAANVPAEADLLCEACGYVLNGLPEGGNCPECGIPTAESAASRRVPPSWETETRPLRRLGAFGVATFECIFNPTRFFRSLTLRSTGNRSRQFAAIHWSIAAVLFGISAWGHAVWSGAFMGLADEPYWILLPLIIITTFFLLAVLSRVAAWLTNLEATYRGLRLPTAVVVRALDYHASHYLPVGLIAATTVVGYRLFLKLVPNAADPYSMPYIYVLCGEVIVTAMYLFRTYWVAMSNLMYANR